MKYKCEYKDEFIVPVFTQESGYWEKIMKPRLQQQRWYIAEVDCVGVEDIVDFGRRLLRALNFSVGDNEYISPIWYENLVGEYLEYLCGKVFLSTIKTLETFYLCIMMQIQSLQQYMRSSFLKI